MTHVKHRRSLVLFGTFLILSAVIYLTPTLLQPVVTSVSAQQTVGLYEAKVALVPGSAIQGEVKVVQVALPSSVASQYLSPSSFARFSSGTVVDQVTAGSLIPISAISTATQDMAKVPVTFQTAPPLAGGDVIDVYVVEPGNGAGSIVPLLRNVTLSQGSGMSWTIAVPMAIAPDLLYVASADKLDALVVGYGTQAPSTQVSSASQAIAAIQANGAN